MVNADREVGDNHEDHSSGDKVAPDLEFPEAGQKRKCHYTSENSSDDDGDGDNSENGDDSENSSADNCDGDNSENGDDSDWENPYYAEWRLPTDEELLECFDADRPEMEPYRNKLVKRFPAIRKYLEQVHLSKGFDIDDWPGFYRSVTTIVPLEVYRESGSLFAESTDFYEDLSKLALGRFNRKNGTAYMDPKFVKVNVQNGSGFVTNYLTFTAVDPDTSSACSSEPTRHTFQSQITVNYRKNRLTVVDFCKLKPGQ